ncbi:hypothetical protein FNF31_06393 [Cafeteria roenbergensis]|nr:hypothetical protein FNF31_06393 [Cafeteria roenbergensis]KAA0164308.1 hypothetical protein FNF28_03939 [Cafeteria roenbergensis]
MRASRSLSRVALLAARTPALAGARSLSAKPVRLSEEEITSLTPAGWTTVEGREAIERKFQFADFSEAWAFMSRSALAAEEMCHHPEWFNVYNTVHVTLATHDCSGLSKNDMELAARMNKFAGSA